MTQERDRYGDLLAADAFCRIGTKRLRHAVYGDGIIGTVEFSPDGKIIATTGRDDCTICLWDVKSGELLHRIKALDGGRMERLVFSPKGDWLVSYESWDRKVQLWDVTSGKRIHWADVDQSRAVAFSRDGDCIATVQSDCVSIFDCATSRRLCQFGLADCSDWLAWVAMPTRETICAASRNEIFMWNISPRKLTHRVRCSKPSRNWWREEFEISADGRLIAAKASDQYTDEIDVYDTSNLQLLGAIKGSIWAFRFSPKHDKLVVAGRSGTKPPRIIKLPFGYELASTAEPKPKEMSFGLYKWDISKRHVLDKIADKVDFPYYVRFVDSIGAIVHVQKNEPHKRYAALTDIHSGEIIREFPPFGNAEALAVSPDEKLLAVACQHGTIGIFELSTGDDAVPLKRHFLEIDRMRFSNDERTVATVSSGQLMIWETETGRQLYDANCDFHSYDSFAMSPDGSLVAGCLHHQVDENEQSCDSVRVYEISTGEIRATIPASNRKMGLSFDSDNILAVYSDRELPIRYFDANGRLVDEKPYPNGYLFSPSGQPISIDHGNDRIKLTTVGKIETAYHLNLPEESDFSHLSVETVSTATSGGFIACVFTDWSRQFVIVMWNYITGEIHKTFEINCREEMWSDSRGRPVTAVSPTNQCFVALSEHVFTEPNANNPTSSSVELWEIMSERKLLDFRQIDILETDVQCPPLVALSHHGKYLAAACDNRVLLWKTSELIEQAN